MKIIFSFLFFLFSVRSLLLLEKFHSLAYGVKTSQNQRDRLEHYWNSRDEIMTWSRLAKQEI